MRTLLVVSGLLMASAVAAKPLPAGLKVVAKDGRPYIQQGKTLVPLRDDEAADYEKILKAELTPDGKTVEVTADRCAGAAPGDVTKISLAKVQARLDHDAGMVALAKAKYPAAITKLTSAVHKDGETPAYATSLLRAQLLGKKTALANQTLAAQGRKNPVWFAWRMAVDTDLAAAAALKGAADLVAAKPGSATVAKLTDRDLATSALGGGMAALHTFAAGTSPTSDIDVVSLTSGKLLARLPLITVDDACGADDGVCEDAARERIAERTKLADSLLASLGFDLTANAFIDVRNGDPVSKDGVSVEITDDAITASRSGGDERTLAIDGGAWGVAITPKAVVVRLNRRNLLGCPDGSSRFVGVALALP